MALTGANVSDQQDVLTPFQVIAGHQFANQLFIDRRLSPKVETLKRLQGRESSCLDSSLCGSLFAFDQFLFCQTEQISRVSTGIVVSCEESEPPVVVVAK